MKTKIYYVMDTMCGWCYGFSDVITKVEEKYKDIYDFSILPGGMWVGDNSKTIDVSLGDYIKSHNMKIEQLTGKKFGDGYNKNILANTSIVLDSFPGAKALVLIQRLKKDVSFRFLKKLQEAFFIEGKDTNNLETYIEIAKSFDISKEEFEKEFLSEELTQETLKYFDMVVDLGALSFPTVILVNGDKKQIISQGYSKFEDIDKILASSNFKN
ncbi:DsbA family protein [Clostridium gasigenes]|uniref:DsbA family protein n=1 Tax=Clostridium gasigenes TaxID=94869 RepID=UPI00143857C0|nr:DsbA family protein [Clostridium gasigenes]MBU3130964.1 DsbA family protein [Clostridium gasigenes]NKF07250.1 DsbA family protein [Clostridium gasigenes]QSW18229.1 DsbA family protein [Clostridium gasigenes]